MASEHGGARTRCPRAHGAPLADEPFRFGLLYPRSGPLTDLGGEQEAAVLQVYAYGPDGRAAVDRVTRGED